MYSNVKSAESPMSHSKLLSVTPDLIPNFQELLEAFRAAPHLPRGQTTTELGLEQDRRVRGEAMASHRLFWL